jgi:hypothetical protein
MPPPNPETRNLATSQEGWLATRVGELLPILLAGFPMVGTPRKENLMRGYVARKGDRWYAVVYEGWIR